MNDKYLKKVSNKIKKSIENGEYILAGRYFLDLVKYGIAIEYEILVMICSELSDVYRNSFGSVKEFKDVIDNNTITQINMETVSLLDFLIESPSELNKEKKIELFDTMTFIIFNAEAIQAETSNLEDARILRKRIYRRDLR